MTVWVADSCLGARTDPNANVEHPVREPSQVWIELTGEGAEAALEIESENGRKTILEFQVETVKGMMPLPKPAADNA